MDWKKAFKIQGWMKENELQWLYERSLEMDSIVEIGSWKGRSTYALCCGCKGEVYAIDHFKGSVEHQNLVLWGYHECTDNPYGEFKVNMEAFDNCSLFIGSSEEASKSLQIPDVVDMVFIDGDHTFEGVTKDLQSWSHRAKKLLCGHDFNEIQVRDALVEFFPGRDIISVEDTWFWKI